MWRFKLECLNSMCTPGEATARQDRWKVIYKAAKASRRKRRVKWLRWLKPRRLENRFKRVALRLAAWVEETYPGKVKVERDDARYRLVLQNVNNELTVEILMGLGIPELRTHFIVPFAQLNQHHVLDSGPDGAYDLHCDSGKVWYVCYRKQAAESGDAAVFRFLELTNTADAALFTFLDEQTCTHKCLLRTLLKLGVISDEPATPPMD
jgi:hypothetical protein